VTNLANRQAALELLVKGSLAAFRLDSQILDNIALARRDGLKAQTFDGEGSPTASDPKLPVELGPDGNVFRDATPSDRRDYEQGLITALDGLSRALVVARKYANLDTVSDDGTAPAGWCVSHYRLDHMHEPVAEGRYDLYCRFCGEFRAAVQAMVKPKKLGRRAGEPPTDLLDHRHRYGRTTQAAVDEAVEQIAGPLMPKRKKAS